jgi:flagellar biogenesis protein FliO
MKRFPTFHRWLINLLGLIVSVISVCPVCIADTSPGAHAPQQSVIGSSALSFGDASSRVFKGLAYTVCALGLTLSLLKFINGRHNVSSPLTIDIVARRSLSSRISLVVVEIDGRRLLISQGTEDARLITELESDLEALSEQEDPSINTYPRAVHN